MVFIPHLVSTTTFLGGFLYTAWGGEEAGAEAPAYSPFIALAVVRVLPRATNLKAGWQSTAAPGGAFF